MNLLTEPMLRVQTAAGIQLMNLPELLAALGTDTVESLLGLQRHQEDTLHIFLCYLGGAVLARAGINNPMQSEEFWREGLRQLAGRNDDCAWTLVVDDVMQPAFMQAPLANPADWTAFKPKAETPDKLDLLVTSKNLDIKAQRIQANALEAWVFALISLQTMTCYLGNGQYGIARSSSGTGCRPRVSLIFSENSGSQWIRDTKRLLEIRPSLLKESWKYKGNGLVLTWESQWNLKTSLMYEDLDPFFIEISRAIRLKLDDEGITAYGAVSGPRIIPKIIRDKIMGNLGDPWIPIDKESGSALKLKSEGFTPQLLRNLILGDKEGVYKPASMQELQIDDKQCWFYAAALVRRGKKDSNTDGFHQATVRILARVTPCLFNRGAERDRLAELSAIGLQDTSAMQNKVLTPALYSFLEAGAEKTGKKGKEITAWVEQTKQFFSEAWEAVFFDWLWSTVEEPDKDAARLKWLQLLEKHARTTLENAITRLPVRSGRYYRSRVRAWGMFNGCRNKIFPELKEIAHAERDDRSAAVAS